MQCWLLYQNEVKCSAFDMEMIHSHGNKLISTRKVAAGVIVKVRVFKTRKWPIILINHGTELHSRQMYLSFLYNFLRQSQLCFIS